MDEAFIGTIVLFAGGYAPQGWAFCDGTLLYTNQSRNQALYSLIGTTYGGDGRTTFALPDLRGRVPVGEGMQSGTAYPLGKAGGAVQVQLEPKHLPAHTHPTQVALTAQVQVKASTTPATSNSPAGNTLAAFAGKDGNQDAVVGNQYAAAGAPLVPLAGTTAVATVGGNVAVLPSPAASASVSLMQPYLPLNYIICLEGIYPPRP